MRTKWYLFGCATSLILLILIVVISFFSIMKAAKNPVANVPSNAALVLQLDKYIPEYTNLENSNFNYVPLSVFDIVKKINDAKDDPRVNCIIIKPSFLTCGYASAHEIGLALQNFKKSGKQVYAYLNMAGQKDYHLVSYANKVYLNPSSSAGIILTGVGSNITFYKDLLDKLGVEFKVIRAGKYKAAGETMSRNSMSPEFKNNLLSLYSDVYTELVKDLANNRNNPEDSIKYIFEKRPYLIVNQELSKSYKLVDELITEEDMYKKLQIDKENLISVSKYPGLERKTFQRNIAVIYAYGEITPVKASLGSMSISAKEMKKVIDAVKTDQSVKAVVIRVNSPGGSALESDIINNYIMDLKKVKPVVISMGDVAASGGYYISSNANYIFADPYTITGSIGVISMIPDLNKLSKKIGLKSESVGYGKYINALDTWNGVSPELQKSFQESVDKTYLEFKTVVSKGRNMSLAKVDSIAQGRVWSAQDAKEIGLIDQIGSLNDAVIKAAALVNCTSYGIDVYPKKKQLISAILEDEFNFGSMAKVLTGKFDLQFVPYKAEQLLDSVKKDPLQMRLPFIIDEK